MEMELGLKFTRVADEFTSDFQLMKDRAGPLFLSRETDSMFILTAHLKGYKRRNIRIDINEDATLIAISGEKQVKETVMVGWQVVKKGTETKVFKKVFKIPDGVFLDKIKAKFNEDESTLTITMPKKVKGIRGTHIEEIKENQELVKEGSSNLQIADEKGPSSNTGTSNQARNEENDKEDKEEEKPVLEHSNTRDDDGLENGEEGQQLKDEEKHLKEQEIIEEVENNNGVEKEEVGDDIQERSANEEVENKNGVFDRRNDIISEEEKVDEEKEGAEEVDKPRGKRCKMCIPIVAGSTLLVSLVVFVIQMVRSKNQISRRRD
ncbi:hypothetical protein ABFS82_14G305200 [Erythranthe guttata]